MLAAVSPVLRLARKGFKRPVKLLVVNSKLHELFLAMCMNFHWLFDSLPLFGSAVNLKSGSEVRLLHKVGGADRDTKTRPHSRLWSRLRCDTKTAKECFES